MNYWHMQLHPNNKELFPPSVLRSILLDTKTIGLYNEKWEEGKKDTLKQYKEIMKIGDVVFIISANILVQVTSDWYMLPPEEVNEKKDWYRLRRNISILSENTPAGLEDFLGKIFSHTTLQRIEKMEAYQYIDAWYRAL